MRKTAAWCGGAAALVSLVGLPFEGATPAAKAASSIVAPAPAPPGEPGGALPVHPAGGGGCVIGLNCGCIANITCPKPPRHPPVAGAKQPDPSPAPHTP